MQPAIDRCAEAMAARAEAAKEQGWESPDEALLVGISIPESPASWLVNDGVQIQVSPGCAMPRSICFCFLPCRHSCRLRQPDVFAVVLSGIELECGATIAL
jgi:hypothetical protein